MMDKLALTLVAVGVVFVGALFLVVIPKEVRRSDYADHWALTNNCTNLGHARDMASVYFFECDDKIVLKRIK